MLAMSVIVSSAETSGPPKACSASANSRSSSISMRIWRCNNMRAGGSATLLTRSEMVIGRARSSIYRFNMPRSTTSWTRNMPGMRFLSMYSSGERFPRRGS